MKKLFCILLSLGLFVFSVKAQIKYNEAEFKTKPFWIIMMDDTTVNYYQAVRAFNSYWEGRIKPEDDADILIEKGKENPKEEKERRRYEKKLAKMSPAERNEFDRLNYEYKRFENWMNEVKPYVQENGSILTQRQRTDIWNRQQEGIKN